MKRTLFIFGYLVLSFLLFFSFVYAVNFLTRGFGVFSFSLSDDVENKAIDNAAILVTVLKIGGVMLLGVLLGWILSSLISFVIVILNCGKVLFFFDRVFSILSLIPLAVVGVLGIVMMGKLNFGLFFSSVYFTGFVSVLIFIPLMISGCREEMLKRYFMVNKLNGRGGCILSLKYYKPFYVLPVVRNFKWVAPLIFGAAIISYEIFSLEGEAVFTLAGGILEGNLNFLVMSGYLILTGYLLSIFFALLKLRVD